MIGFKDLVPQITDEDISWVVDLLSLKELDERRLAFLRSRETLDISACPGSGKTTLVVAKLAILARKWTSRTRGICVLSHTNVARQEIEHRLGGTEVGRRLLSYPHYIDTIHGFVSRFLATPWLLSAQYRFTAIDDELTHRMRFNCMNSADRRAFRDFLGYRKFDTKKLRLKSADFHTPVIDGKFPSGPTTRMYKIMSSAMGEAAKRGYFCYDEIFVLGKAQLTERPSVAEGLRHRFPCVIIDEMQDTSAMQNEYLSTIFPRHNPAICVTRVGDPNQAIFDSDVHSKGSDFPDSTRSIDIASSFRFDPSIASLADTFAFFPVAGSLCGLRERDHDPLPHTIFVFPDGDCSGVLDAYAQLVLDHLPAALLPKAKVAALGYTHKEIDPDGDPEHYPKTVGHYWEPYERNAGRTGYRPSTLVERVRLARRHISKGETAHHGVEEIARALLHLVNLSNLSTKLKVGARQHVQVQQLFTEAKDLERYQQLVVEVLFKGDVLSCERWLILSQRFWDLTKILACTNDKTEAAQDYLGWVVENQEGLQERVVGLSVNTYRSVHEKGAVDIKLGSIHSVKGQTHTATLVLETFSHEPFLDSLMPWVLRKRVHGHKRLGVRDTQRLLAMYVAMTRPTHLLCLAISNRTLVGDEQFQPNCQALIDLGWNVQHL
ncbi:DNA helicase II [compost metagenome]